MRKHLAVGMVSVGLLFGVACVEGDEPGPEEVTASGLNLTVDMQGMSDVVAMRYTLTQCGGNSVPVKVVEKDLEDLVLPGGIPSFVNKPFDEDSRHLFADYFTVLHAGCYDVLVEPLTSKGKVSKECRSVEYHGAIVKDGKTTEILLVSQCKGKEVGALDVVAALNHPPYIKGLTYDPSKFLSCPDATVKLCATAKDPDGDPMIFEWYQLMGPELGYPEVVYSKQKNGERTECVVYELPDQAADYKFMVRVYDMFHDKKGLMTAEDWYYKHGYGTIKSRATLKIPLYVSCEEEPPVAEICPRTLGFWMNHKQFWPEGTLDRILYKVGYFDVTWWNAVTTAPAGSVCRILARQYVPAMLNVMVGAYAPPNVLQALEDAEALFDYCPNLDSKQEAQAESVKNLLDDFNNGEYEGEECIDLKNGDNDLPIMR